MMHLSFSLFRKFFLFHQNREHVDRSDGKMDKRTSKSWDGSPVKRRKSQKSNSMVLTLEGSSVERSKSRKINPVVRMVKYAKIARINILLS